MTAVDFFKEELEKQLEFKAVEKFWIGMYEQAKQMEKEQIILTYDYAKLKGTHEYGEQYYEKTFKSE